MFCMILYSVIDQLQLFKSGPPKEATSETMFDLAAKGRQR